MTSPAPTSPAVSLNPFFIRSIVQSSPRPTFFVSTVLIPSSSGQSFNTVQGDTLAGANVLIPSSSGQSFNPRRGRPHRRRPVLIPSSSGQSFNADLSGANLSGGLNPFFIRSIVQCANLFCVNLARVLIPSSSGQSFNKMKIYNRFGDEVLIPSSSGQSFNRPPRR